MFSRAQHPGECWPCRLDGIPESDATAIETTVLTIRMVCRELEKPDLGVSEKAVESPLLHFATCCGNLKAPTLIEALKVNIDGAYNVNLTFASLMDADLTIRDFWGHPELNLYTLYSRPHKDTPWALAKTAGSSGKASEVYWEGRKSLSDTLEALFNTRVSPDMQYFVSMNFPAVIRVKLDAKSGSHQSFETLRHAQFFGKFIGTHSDNGELGLMGRNVHYGLIGAIRHRPRNDSPELVRFYNGAGLYITPPLSVDDKYVPRAYTSDDWEIGTAGYTYTLLYARTGPPVEDGCRFAEFIPESKVGENEDIVSFFRVAERQLRLPQQRGRRIGTLDVSDGVENQQAGGGMATQDIMDILRESIK